MMDIIRRDAETTILDAEVIYNSILPENMTLRCHQLNYLIQNTLADIIKLEIKRNPPRRQELDTPSSITTPWPRMYTTNQEASLELLASHLRGVIKLHY
jgi:hypothetical protein